MIESLGLVVARTRFPTCRMAGPPHSIAIAIAIATFAHAHARHTILLDSNGRLSSCTVGSPLMLSIA
jgi:hypothetical protein